MIGEWSSDLALLLPIPRISLPRQPLDALCAQAHVAKFLFHCTDEVVHAATTERIARSHIGELRAVPEIASGIDERTEGHALAAVRVGGFHVDQVAEHLYALADVGVHVAFEDGRLGRVTG